MLPDVPAIGETVAGYQMNSWYGLFTTVGTPPKIIQRLYAEMAAMVKRPDMVERFAGLGIEAEASSPQVFTAQIKEEIAKWAKVIQLARVPLQ